MDLLLNKGDKHLCLHESLHELIPFVKVHRILYKLVTVYDLLGLVVYGMKLQLVKGDKGEKVELEK